MRRIIGGLLLRELGDVSNDIRCDSQRRSSLPLG